VPTQNMDQLPTRAPRLTLSQIVEQLLSRHTGERSAVTLTRTAAGDTQIDVKVRTGDDTDVQTVEDAERRAREVYDRLAELYPTTPTPDNASVSLSRNAKGETQMEVKASTTAGGAATLDALLEAVVHNYDATRARYPMANGLTAKPGSVA
jgi:hypothetical protein